MAAGKDERAQLARALREHLEWDALGFAVGLPEVPAPAAPASGAHPGAGVPVPASRGPSPAPAPRGSADAPAAGPATAPASAASASSVAPAAPATQESPGDEPAAPEAPAAAPIAPAAAAATQAEGSPLARLRLLEEQVRSCTRCELAKARTQTAFARGNPGADLVFIGEGPGRDEDRLGSPFVGPAGKLLDKMIAAMGRTEQDVYICNVVKCRPPQNRTPLPQEAGACAPYLEGQVDAVGPRIIVALGRCAAENLGCVPPSGGRWRGRWGSYRGVPVMPTYHPAFLLRSPEFKRPVWEDLQQVMRRLASGDGG